MDMIHIRFVLIFHPDIFEVCIQHLQKYNFLLLTVVLISSPPSIFSFIKPWIFIVAMKLLVYQSLLLVKR